VATWRDYTGANLMLGLLSAGCWDELDERLGADQPASVVARVVRAGVRGWLCVARGDAFKVPWQTEGAPESDDPSDRAWIAFADALQAQTEERWDAAVERGTFAVDTMFELSGISDDFVHMWPVAVDVALLTGADDVLSRLLAVVDDASSRLRVPLAVQAHRALFGGLVARDVDPAAAEVLLRSAVDGYSTWGSPQFRARAEAELGLLQRSLGRDEEAQPLLDAGLGVLTEMRARTWLTQLEGERTFRA